VRALERRIFANIALFKGPQYDASHLIDAREQIRSFASAFPAEAEESGLNDALLARIDESEAAQMLETSNWYLRRGDGASARFVLERLVRKHPRSLAASRALQILRTRGWMEATTTSALSDDAGGEGAREEDEPIDEPIEVGEDRGR
jgi:hypothetical protein